MFHGCAPTERWRASLGAGTCTPGPRPLAPAACYLGCMLGQSILGFVGFRVAGGGLGWWWCGLLWALCGFHVPHGHPTVSRWVSRTCEQAQAAPTESIAWGSHWRRVGAQGRAKLMLRMDLFNLPSDCNGGDCPKMASLATLVLLEMLQAKHHTVICYWSRADK